MTQLPEHITFPKSEKKPKRQEQWGFKKKKNKGKSTKSVKREARVFPVYNGDPFLW